MKRYVHPMTQAYYRLFVVMFGLIASCLLASGLAGCSTTATMVPPQLLTCTAQPPAPTAGTQRDVSLYVVDLAAAGDDCRTKLGSVRRILEPAK